MLEHIRRRSPPAAPVRWDAGIDGAIASAHHHPRGAAVADAVARIHRDHTGHGAAHARATLAGDAITIILRDVFTRPERTLIAAGHGELVLTRRRARQGPLRVAVAAAVERLTGRPVAAHISAVHVDPDLAVEVCVLAPPAA